MKFEAKDLLMQGTPPPMIRDRTPHEEESCVVAAYDNKGNPCSMGIKFKPYLDSVVNDEWLSPHQMQYAANEMTRLYRIRKLARKTAKKAGVDAGGWLRCCHLNRFTEQGYLEFLEMAKIPYRGELKVLRDLYYSW